MREITFKDKIKMYWYGLKLKPRRMMGNSGKCTWVIASSHPLYSITWTWALYWTKPSCWKFKGYDYFNNKQVYHFRGFLFLGFHLARQEAILKNKK